MSIRYSCFISYPHGQGEIVKKFTEQFKNALIASLMPWLREEVYMDNRHTSGYSFNGGIAQAICESICMIVVYTPLYQESTYCLREFLAMEQIEEKRKQKLGDKFDRTNRMIIPILLRGDSENLPLKIKGIHYYDFSKFRLTSRTLSKKDKEVIEQIAKTIYNHYQNIKSSYSNIIDDECNKFLLPSEKEAIKSWGKSGNSKSPSLFPGKG